MTVLDCGGRPLDLSRPRVMGILNCTPDSFSDGGAFVSPERAVAHAHAMAEAGADLIDVGGESTRPGAEPVGVEEEIRRVIPVVRALAERLGIPISVDTSKPEVMAAAVEAGAGMINDVRALSAPGALARGASLGVPVCLMHMQGEPRDMQRAPTYMDVLADVRGFLAGRIRASLEAGIAQGRLIVDPGFGFGKTLTHNLALLARLGELADLGVPLMVGFSRKSMLGAICGRGPEGRLAAGLAAVVLALERGAAILRVHDVAETVDAVRVWEAVRTAG
jgi:dihydropteroate synthase